MWGIKNIPKVQDNNKVMVFGFFFCVLCVIVPSTLAGTGGNDISSATRIGGHPILDSGIAVAGQTELTKCPRACTCVGLTIDCAHRGLTQVPGGLPTNAERM